MFLPHIFLMKVPAESEDEEKTEEFQDDSSFDSEEEDSEEDVRLLQCPLEAHAGEG